MYRSALCHFLASCATDVRIVGEASNTPDALALVEQARPDILLLGVEVDWMNGWNVLYHLQQVASRVHVVFLSAYDEPAFEQKALDNGAAACLVKCDVPQQLVETIQNLYKNQHEEASGTAESAVNPDKCRVFIPV